MAPNWRLVPPPDLQAFNRIERFVHWSDISAFMLRDHDDVIEVILKMRITIYNFTQA